MLPVPTRLPIPITCLRLDVPHSTHPGHSDADQDLPGTVSSRLLVPWVATGHRRRGLQVGLMVPPFRSSRLHLSDNVFNPLTPSLSHQQSHCKRLSFRQRPFDSAISCPAFCILTATSANPFPPLLDHSSVKMGHEDAVYLAKLAEQAERYEGTSPIAVATR